MDIQGCFRTVLNSKNLYELADNIDLLVSFFQDVESKRKQKLLSEFYHLLYIQVFFSGQKPTGFIKIYNDEESVPEYLYNYWPWMNTFRKNMAQLKIIADTIYNDMLPSKASGLTSQKIQALFNLVEKKFQYGTRVIRDDTLKILQFNYSHYKWDCYYTAAFEEDQLTRDYVMMTCPHKLDIRQEFGFVHELGHKLHTVLTKKLFMPPKSFSCFHHLYKDCDKQNDQTMSEHFADVFAIAALDGTPYKDCIPFEVNCENAKLFTLYITTTILTMGENTIHSIDELYTLENKLSELQLREQL